MLNHQNSQRKRQPDYEGTLETLPSGKHRYIGQVMGQQVRGSAKRTLRDAKVDYKSKVQAILAPTQAESAIVQRVHEYIDLILNGAYKKRISQGTLAPSTWQLYEQVLRLNIASSSLGRKALHEVTPGDIESWAGQLTTIERRNRRGVLVSPSGPMANSTKRRYIGMLGGFFEHARVKDKVILVNPVNDCEKPEFVEAEYRILSAAECEEIMLLSDKENPNQASHEAEKDRRRRSNRRRRLILLLGLHGFGPAEMCGLRYEDVDGDGIDLKRQRQRLRNLGVLERDRLKTKDRKAWVAIDEDLKTMLSEQKVGYVLETSRGGATEPSNLRRTFTGMVTGTKFEGMKPYDLRHTFAMRLLEAGVDVKTAAEMMRHSVEVFLRRYVRSDRSRKVDAIKKLRADRDARMDVRKDQENGNDQI
ncbi:MAG: tyrosine-type recombinase/integrase [Chlorobia bacterium]|nr:tyrosine-type recombinase/integrase [Fimbriimonadaceae bacterium]